MTEIIVEPYKKLIIRTYYRYSSYEEMAREVVKGVTFPYVVLRWNNGILFNFISYPATDFISRELAQGILYWDHLEFAEMKDFREVIPVEGSPVKVYVRNFNGHPLFDQLSKFIKENLLS